MRYILKYYIILKKLNNISWKTNNLKQIKYNIKFSLFSKLFLRIRMFTFLLFIGSKVISYTFKLFFYHYRYFKYIYFWSYLSWFFITSLYPFLLWIYFLRQKTIKNKKDSEEISTLQIYLNSYLSISNRMTSFSF